MARRAALGLRHHRTRRRADPDPTGVSTAADERLRALDRKERLAMLTGPFWYVRSRAATRSERREVFS
jgi:hypothetical protein